MRLPCICRAAWPLVVPTLLVGACAPVLAAGFPVTGSLVTESRAAPGQAVWQPVDDAQLASMRGGFVTPSGLILSLGIERSVSINGALVAQTSFTINDVRTISSGEAGALREAMQPVVTQRGTANLLPSSLGQAGPGNVVQNSLNDQVISTRTVISTAINSGTLLKEINFMSSVRDASTGALAPRN